MTRKTTMAALGSFAAILMAGNPAFADKGGVPQASITLLDNAMVLCHHNDTAWTLDKSGVYEQTTALGVGTVTWTVTVTRGATTDNFLDVDGYITIANTGTADATIGNIVVNLQKRTFINNNQYWISAAANCADHFSGDIATKANILAAASQENPNLNANPGPGNYTISGQQGTFVEGPGSGTLSFRDATDNTIWSLVTNNVITPGQSVSLKWVAEFDNSVLQIPVGNPVRMEIIVTFGNAGARGGSGASACNQGIDIDGNPTPSPDEDCIRSVPARVSLEVPALQECNKFVTLTDTLDDGLSTTTNSTVIYGNYQSDIPNNGVSVLSDSTTNTISIDVAGGSSGGTICNTAYLTGQNGFVSAGSNQFDCCVGVNLDKQKCVDVPPQGTPPPPCDGCSFTNGEYCSYTQGGWGAPPNGGNPAQMLCDNFATVYPSGKVVVGRSPNYTMTFQAATAISNATYFVDVPDPKPNDPNHTKQVKTNSDFTVSLAPCEFIVQYLPAGSTAGQLNSSLLNPDSTSAGVFGGQVLALQLNVDFSAASIPAHTGGALGALVFQNTGTALDGHTVAELLADCNTVLGGGASAYGFSVATLNAYADAVNNAFDNCVVKDWANTYLKRP